MARIVVLGGAESGVGAAVLAKVKGFDVFLSDNGKIKDEYLATLKKWDIPFEQGGHTPEKILDADEVIKSPGIPGTAPMIKALREQGTHIVSEIEFAGRYDSAKKICVTGSNGKTTTTSLIYHLLREAGLDAGLGGNKEETENKSSCTPAVCNKIIIFIRVQRIDENTYDFTFTGSVYTSCLFPDIVTCNVPGFIIEKFISNIPKSSASSAMFIIHSKDPCF